MNMQLVQSARYSTFGRGAVKIAARPGQALAIDEIAAKAPAIFAPHAHESRSERFVHIPTFELLEGMQKAGFSPVSVTVGGSKIAEKRAFTKHMIRFRKSDQLGTENLTLGGLVPEVALLNAHDGTSSYQLHAGLFRMVCLNGLIVADGAMASIKVGHRGNALDKVIEGSYQVLDHATQTLPRAEAMAQINLTHGESELFARAALGLRFDTTEAGREYNPQALIRPRRVADLGSDLWSTFNRAQEGLIRGGFEYRAEDSNGRMQYRSARAVNNPGDNIKLNQALWQLAEGMAALKGQAIAA